ncbi:hypothetical protein NC651_027211 [Populus alba x Populus x berolinensis]|nr:hypothetical protein NC651_027211 [Populus alba x Populus x berolinensis]
MNNSAGPIKPRQFHSYAGLIKPLQFQIHTHTLRETERVTKIINQDFCHPNLEYAVFIYPTTVASCQKLLMACTYESTFRLQGSEMKGNVFEKIDGFGWEKRKI